MRNLTTGLRPSPRPKRGLVPVHAQGMENKSTHKSTLTTRRGSSQSSVWLRLDQAHKSPSEHVMATLLFGGVLSSPKSKSWGCHSLHDLPPAMANGLGWTGDRTAVGSSPGTSAAAPFSLRESWVCEHAHTEEPTELRAC